MRRVFKTPLYSQHRDIKNKKWNKKACGIAALAMMCEYHRPDTHIPFPRLIAEGIRRRGYQRGVGWKHASLAELCRLYRLRGKNFDFAKNSAAFARRELRRMLQTGPVVVSMWRDAKRHTGGHLVTAVGYDHTSIFLNDPEGKTDAAIQKRVHWKLFDTAWKKRAIAAFPPSRVAKKR